MFSVVLPSMQPAWDRMLMSVTLNGQSGDPDDQLEIHHLYIIVTALAVTLVILIVLFVIVLRLYRRNKISNTLLLQKNNEIGEQRKSNEKITETLEQQRKEIEQQEHELQDTTTELRWQTENALRLYDEIEQQKEEITSSIMYASRIQTVLLPETTVINEILNDYFVLFRPRDIVSGDFYWVSAKDNKTIVVVADCTGHGVPGAFMSILGISFLNEIVRIDPLRADDVLNRMRNYVIKALKQTGKDMETKDGMDMALCVIDWEHAQVEYAGANIPLYLLRQTDGSSELIELQPDHMPIGIYTIDNSPFSAQSISVASGDAIYMFSDGYCDQFGGDQLKKFKKKNFKKLLLDIHTLDMSEQKRILERTLDSWKGDLPQVDDILILGIRI